MSTMPEYFLMIADSHLVSGESEEQFFAVLDKISALPTTVAVAFLGDVFELWIAVNNYETDSHYRFLAWCEKEKAAGRQVFFTEGNHEFFLHSKHGKSFTDSGRHIIICGDVAFFHGDTMNSRDIPYFLLRCGVRNHVTRFLLWLFGKTFGPKLSDCIRKRLKTTNMVHKKNFPESDVRIWGEKMKRRGVHHAFIGHFHNPQDVTLDGIEIHALPAYQNTREIGLFNTKDKTFLLFNTGDLDSVTAEIQQKGQP